MSRRALLWIVGVLIFVASSAGIFVVKKAKFPGFPGNYICGELGIPGKSNNRLVVSEDGVVVSRDSEGKNETPVGSITVQSAKRALLELNMTLIHDPDFSLDPLATHFLVAKRQHVRLVGTKLDTEVYSHLCKREKP